MGEVFGIVTGVIGLLPLCSDGLSMIKDICSATQTMELAVGRIELQKDRYDEWRDMWRDEKGERDVKFESYAEKEPATAKRIWRQLALMSQTLYDVRVLEDSYGFNQVEGPHREPKDLSQFRLKSGQELSLEIQTSFLERCKVNLSFMKKCKFVFRKKESQLSDLINLLKEYNENLATYGPKIELERMLKAEFDSLRILKQDELHRRADASAFEARNSVMGSEESTHYHNLSLAATFSSIVKYERRHGATKFSMQDFRFDPSYIITSNPAATMALLFDYPVRKEHRVVLVEWINDEDRDQERDTRIKTLMLATPKPPQLLLPMCYGMVEDTVNRRSGLVLAPPSHIRSGLPSILPAGAISQKRMPVSLMELMEKKHASYQQVLDLGVRFELAKKLVGAVHMMHSVGWVHKNIRTNSIIFYASKHTPAHKDSSPGPDPGFPQTLFFDEPLLVGLFHARLDDMIDDPDPYYAVQRRAGSGGGGSGGPRDINLDYYQHPDKRFDPHVRYSRAHDIYSLGVVLLELGLWKALDKLIDVEDQDYDLFMKRAKECTLRLEGMMGSIYATVVRRCLSISTRERTETELRNLSKFCSDIAASLGRCMA